MLGYHLSALWTPNTFGAGLLSGNPGGEVLIYSEIS
jgi:hypothetical protein